MTTFKQYIKESSTEDSPRVLTPLKENIAHWKRQLGSSEITAAEKREIQQKIHDAETKARARQTKTAESPDTELDVAMRAGDAASEPVTPAPQKQRTLTPADRKKGADNAPAWVKKKTAEAEAAV